jgi:hypothetical protein
VRRQRLGEQDWDLHLFGREGTRALWVELPPERVGASEIMWPERGGALAVLCRPHARCGDADHHGECETDGDQEGKNIHWNLRYFLPNDTS